MSGSGNIYRTELLWRARIHPLTSGREITRAQFAALWDDAVRLLQVGVETGAILTREGAGPSTRRYRERVNIMGHETCPRCGGPIRKLTIATRRAFVCEHCQPPPGGDQ